MRTLRALTGLVAVMGLVAFAATASSGQGSLKWPTGGGAAQPSPGDAQPGLQGAAQMAQQHLMKGIEFRKKNKLNEAIQEFKAVIKIVPRSPAGYYYLGLTYLAKGDFKSAEPQLKKVADFDPKNPDVRLQLLQINMQTQDFSEAVAYGRQAVKLKPKDARVRFMLGYAYLSSKNLGSAASEFRAVTQIDPKNVGGWFNLAMVYMQTNDLARARPVLAKAAALAPKDDRIMGMQAELEMKTDKVNGPKKALALFKKVAAKNPQNGQLQFQLAMMYERTGQTKPALDIYRKLIAKYPDVPAAKLNAARILLADRTSPNAKDGYKQAADYLRPIVKKMPDFPQAAGMLGLAELYLGDNQNAEIHYKQAQKAEPNNPMVLEGLAYIYQAGGKPKDAVKIVEKLHDMRPDDPKLGIRLAGMYDQTGDKTKALGLYQQMVEKFPKNTEVMAARASYLQQQKELQKAADQYRAILKIKPDDLETQMKIAYVYAYSDDKAERDKAVPELEAAKKIAVKMKPPKDDKEQDHRIEPYQVMASIYERDKDYAKAAAQFTEYLQVDPKSKDASRNLAQTYEKDTSTVDKAIEEYHKLIDAYPDDRQFYGMAAAAVKKKTGNADDDVAEVRKYIDAKPTNMTPRYVLAQMLLSREGANLDDAAAQYSEVLKTKPDDEEAMVGLARVYDKQKKVDEAIAQYKKTLEKKPSQGGALRSIQRLVNEKNDSATTNDWLAYLKTLIDKKDAGASAIYTMLLDDYAKANRGPEAIAAIEALAKKDPKDVQAILAIGGYCEKTGDFAKGLTTYKKVAMNGIVENHKATAYKGIGNIYFSQRKYSEALKAYKEWKSRQMFFFGIDQTQVRMAQCLEYTGKTDEALAEYENLKNGDLNNQEVQDGIRRLKPQPTVEPNIPRLPGPENAPPPPAPAGPVAPPAQPPTITVD